MYIPAWLIPFVAVLLWACYYYRYGYLELRRKAGKSEREAKQEDNILVGTLIEPKHANPKLRRWGWRISDSLRRFFADFDRFGVIANGWAPIKNSPWRLQELKDTKLRTFDSDTPKQGRRYDVFYNQQRVGSLEISDTSDYTTDESRVCANVLIRDARLIPLDDVSRFLTSIAMLLSAGTGEEYAEAEAQHGDRPDPGTLGEKKRRPGRSAGSGRRGLIFGIGCHVYQIADEARQRG